MALAETAVIITKLASASPMAVEIAGALIDAPHSPLLPETELFGWTGQNYAFDAL